MSIYEKTNVARALLYWAKNNNGNEAYYLEDRMYAVADGDMVIILTADSYDEAIQKANGERPQGEIATNCNQIATKLQQTQDDCISREALKKAIEKYRPISTVKSQFVNGMYSMFMNCISEIDNAPTVDTACPHCDSGYAQGCSDGYLRGKGELANEVWNLYEKHHSHLATHVIEFGDELKELLGKYQRGGAEND